MNDNISFKFFDSISKMNSKSLTMQDVINRDNLMKEFNKPIPRYNKK